MKHYFEEYETKSGISIFCCINCGIPFTHFNKDAECAEIKKHHYVEKYNLKK